jgi:hypothetical protein
LHRVLQSDVPSFRNRQRFKLELPKPTPKDDGAITSAEIDEDADA